MCYFIIVIDNWCLYYFGGSIIFRVLLFIINLVLGVRGGIFRFIFGIGWCFFVGNDREFFK